MKYLCDNCKSLAVWLYMPGKQDDGFYCEEHVPRGCSCQVLDNGTMDTDDEGRFLPCVEYDYSESGFRVREV